MMNIHVSDVLIHYTNGAVSLSSVLHELRVGLRQLYGENAPRVILYGSYARDEARSDSDIDLLLLFSHPIQTGREITRVSQLLADLNLRYEVLVSVVPALEDQYQSLQGPFWQNVRREGIEINGY